MKKNKKIYFFSDTIRHMFILYAIIPVFIIASMSMLSFYVFRQYTAYTMNTKSNDYVRSELELTIAEYSSKVHSLAQDVSLVKDTIDMNQLVEIRRLMYKLSSSTGFNGSVYILNNKLQSVLPDYNDTASFLIDKSVYNWGIIGKIMDKPNGISIKLANNQEDRILCIGSPMIENGEIIGYVVMTIDAHEFSQVISKVSSQSMITDKYGWIYIKNIYNYIDSLGRIDRNLQDLEGFHHMNGEWYHLSKSSIFEDELLIYTFSNHGIQTKMFLLMGLFIFVIFLTIILITFFISGKVTKKSTKDIRELAQAFDQVKKGNLERYLYINSSVEFRDIGEAYNMMLNGLKKHMKENKELVENIAFAQVKQLEAQFNPHFLFNTLDNIRFMSKMEPDLCDNMIVALSSLLRYSISNAKEEIEVAEDMSYTENYLTILKIRFNRRFTYDIDMTEDVKNCLIPKLMMQSLIENAVKYGFDGDDCLHVSIKGYMEDGRLIFLCEDNGIGMKEEILKQINDTLRLSVNKSNHLGIYNIHRRIQLLYGKEYGVSLESKVGEGTIVKIVLPIFMK